MEGEGNRISNWGLGNSVRSEAKQQVGTMEEERHA